MPFANRRGCRSSASVVRRTCCRDRPGPRFEAVRRAIPVPRNARTPLRRSARALSESVVVAVPSTKPRISPVPDRRRRAVRQAGRVRANCWPSSTKIRRTRPNRRVRSKRRFSRSRTRARACRSTQRKTSAGGLACRAVASPLVASASLRSVASMFDCSARPCVASPGKLAHSSAAASSARRAALGSPASAPPGSGRRISPGRPDNASANSGAVSHRDQHRSFDAAPRTASSQAAACFAATAASSRRGAPARR